MSVFRTVSRRAPRAAGLSAALVTAGFVLAGPASAHVTITPGEGDAGEFTVATIAVPHGCDGSSTTKVVIKVPEELNAITPTRNGNWDVTKKVAKLATPVTDAHGNEITERVSEVTYTAKTPLPDGFRDAFDLSFQVPDASGKTIYFPTIQTCEKGETAWVEIAADGAEEPEHPAPAYRVLEATGDSDHHDAGDDSDAASKGLAYTGLAVGALGLLTAAVALVKGRRKA